MVTDRSTDNEIRGIYLGVNRECRVPVVCGCSYCKRQAREEGRRVIPETVSIPEKLDELAENNINHVILDVPREVYFNTLFPFEDTLSSWEADPLEEFITQAHRRGIAVYLILSGCFYEFEPFIREKARAEGWHMVNAAGRKVPYGDPGNPGLTDFYIRANERLVREYDIDGISLDFIRYPEMEITGDCCYCALCRTRFSEKYGFAPTVLRVREKNTGAREQSLVCGQYLWDMERRNNITTFVRDVARTVRSVRDTIQVSAYVWGIASFKLVYQDWSAWIDDGSLDWINPSGYDYDIGSYRRRCIELGAVLAGRCPSCITIGHHTTHGKVRNAGEMVKQIKIAAEAGVGANGFILFTHSHKELSGYLPAISKVRL